MQPSLESKVELILEQIRRAQCNVHNVTLYLKRRPRAGSVACAYVDEALKLARVQCLEAAALIDGELEANERKNANAVDPATKAARREAAIRSLYIRAATSVCTAAVAEMERQLNAAEDDGDIQGQIEDAKANLATARAQLDEAIRLAAENFDMTADLAEAAK